MKAAIVASLTLLSLTAPAFAAPTVQYQFRGETASAYFSQSDGCNSAYVDVYSFDNVTKDAPGAPTSQKEAYLYYSNYNYCTGVGSYGAGSSKDATFTIGNSLQSASLSGTFALFDYSTAVNRTAAVDLSWVATGDTYRGNSHYHYQGSGYRAISRSVGSSRDASVTGTVNVDGINLIANLPSFATLSSSNNGFLNITRN